MRTNSPDQYRSNACPLALYFRSVADREARFGDLFVTGVPNSLFTRPSTPVILAIKQEHGQVLTIAYGASACSASAALMMRIP